MTLRFQKHPSKPDINRECGPVEMHGQWINNELSIDLSLNTYKSQSFISRPIKKMNDLDDRYFLEWYSQPPKECAAGEPLRPAPIVRFPLGDRGPAAGTEIRVDVFAVYEVNKEWKRTPEGDRMAYGQVRVGPRCADDHNYIYFCFPEIVPWLHHRHKLCAVLSAVEPNGNPATYDGRDEWSEPFEVYANQPTGSLPGRYPTILKVRLF